MQEGRDENAIGGISSLTLMHTDNAVSIIWTDHHGTGVQKFCRDAGATSLYDVRGLVIALNSQVTSAT
jgi:oligoribonuclease NrnB/cAMP/cGMP phosphodiesterase (DHH superfamily)